VLPSDMVENSTCSLRRHFELDVCHWTVRIGHLLPGEAPSEFFCWHLHWLPRDMTLQALLASVAFKQKPTAMGMRVPRVPSIVDVFSRLPLPEFAADNVAPPVCHLALAAARAPLGVIREDAQNVSLHATTPDGPEAVRPVEKLPRCGVPALRRASRTVRFTRSIQAVLSRPEKPNRGLAPLRAASVPRPITCVTQTSLRQRSAFLHLAIDQTYLHLPPAHIAPSTNSFTPLSKMSREGIEVHIEAITGEERDAERRPRAVAGSG
jgi:hypothetical protein